VKTALSASRCIFDIPANGAGGGLLLTLATALPRFELEGLSLLRLLRFVAT